MTARCSEYRRGWGIGRFAFVGFYRKVIRVLGIQLFQITARLISDGDELLYCPPGISCRQLTVDELRSAARDSSLCLSEDFVEAALRRGDFCIGALDGSTLVAYAWRSFAVTPHIPGISVSVRAPGCYSYNIFTRKEYRGRGIWPALTRFSDQICLNHSRTLMIGFIELDNVSSLRAAEKLGGVRVGIAGYVSFFGRITCFHSKAVARSVFRFINEGNSSIQR